MKTKDLFKKVEAANFINREMWGIKRPFGLQVYIKPKTGSDNEVEEPKANDGGFAFATWKEFIDAATGKLAPEIINLIENEKLCKKDWDYMIDADKWRITFILWERGL